MKNILNITIIKELLFIINFREVNNEEDIKKLAYSARLVTMFILFSLICLIGILIAKEKFYYPINVTIVILVACFFVVIPIGILFIRYNSISHRVRSTRSILSGFIQNLDFFVRVVIYLVHTIKMNVL